MGNPAVYINGKRFHGWNSLKVKRSIYAAAGVFEISGKPHETMGVGKSEEWNLVPGAKVEILGEQSTRELNIGSDTRLVDTPFVPIASGFIDVVESRVEGDNRTIVAQGRDKTSDLIDCSAPWQPGEFRNFTLIELVSKLTAPFGTQFNASGEIFDNPKRLPLFRVEAGESSWSAIERACRIFGVLAYGNELGQIEIAKVGSPGGSLALREGDNVLSIVAKHSHAERFSEYQVVGQAPGDDDSFGPAITHASGFAQDAGIERYRPLTVIAEDSLSSEGAQARAEWEASVRAARGSTVSVIYPGWNRKDVGFTGHAGLWRVNEIVPVVSPSNSIDGKMLIVETAYTLLASEPERARITLARPDAFILKPTIGTGEDPFVEVQDGGWSVPPALRRT